MQVDHGVKGGTERMLFILSTLAKLERSVSIGDLMAETGLAKSTLYRQLALLKRWGFVMDSGEEYLPGPMCLPLARGFEQSSYLRQAARAELAQLARTSGESVGLLMEVNHQVVCIEMIESRQPLRCSFVKGRGLPLVGGASAKALLAFMERDRQAVVLRDLQRDGLLSTEERERLEEQLATIQTHGYVCSDSEVDAGVWGVSAPIFQAASHAIAVVTLMAPNTRIDDRTRAFTDMTVRVASRIAVAASTCRSSEARRCSFSCSSGSLASRDSTFCCPPLCAGCLGWVCIRPHMCPKSCAAPSNRSIAARWKRPGRWACRPDRPCSRSFCRRPSSE